MVLNSTVPVGMVVAVDVCFVSDFIRSARLRFVLHFALKAKVKSYGHSDPGLFPG